MSQKNNPTYPQAKGAPAGVILPGVLLAKTSLARANYSVLTDDQQVHSLNAETGLVRISATTKGLFVAFAENPDGLAGQAYTTLTLAANPTEDDEMTLGDQLYTFKAETLGYAKSTLTLNTTITPGSHAESVVSANTIIDGSKVTIGAIEYTFKTALSLTPTAYEVLIGASDATALDNLKSAINATAGAGTTYGTGTVAHPDVVATTNTDTTQKVVARVPGTAANTKATTSLDATLSWPDITLGGGTSTSNPGVAPETATIGGKTYSFVDVLSETNGAAAIANQVLFGSDTASALDNFKLAINGGATVGTNYSTGTTANANVTATTNTNTTQLCVAIVPGVAGNSIATTETMSQGSWTSTVMAGGHTDDGHTIVIGGSAGATQANVQNAINGTGTPGTDYSSALVKNTLVYAKDFATNASKVTAIASGTAGTGIVTTGTFASGSNTLSATATSGGTAGNFDDYIPAGTMHEYAVDSTVTLVGLLADGATAGAIITEHN